MLQRPKRLKKGDTIGIITPSFAGNVVLRDKFETGVEFLRSQGFDVLLGDLTAKFKNDGYRSGTPEERAQEFNAVYKNPGVSCIIFSIGGSNSGSLLEYIDYRFIRNNPKIVCGYSDATAIHCALQKVARLCTFYGPAVIPSFGEFPAPHEITLDCWESQMGLKDTFASYAFPRPEAYSDHFIDAADSKWKTVKREFKQNEGWQNIRDGNAKAPIFAYNLNTLVSLAGTKYFPDLKNSILCLEQMDTDMAKEERQLHQLKLMGVFKHVKALIVSKAERFSNLNASFDHNELLLEIFHKENFPIITNFDCGHTHPMLTIAQGVECEISASADNVSVLQHGMGVV